MYILPLGDIIQHYGISFDLYADDKQLYLAFGRSDILRTKVKMEDLVQEICQWLVLNLVKCNDDRLYMLTTLPLEKNLSSPLNLLET